MNNGLVASLALDGATREAAGGGQLASWGPPPPLLLTKPE